MKNILIRKMNAKQSQPHFIIFQVEYSDEAALGISGTRTEIIIGEQAFREYAFDFFLGIHQGRNKNDPDFVKLKAMDTQEIIDEIQRCNVAYGWVWYHVLIVTGNNMNILDKSIPHIFM